MTCRNGFYPCEQQAHTENDVLTKMTRDVLPEESVDQYVKEERSLLAKRAASESQRLHDLLACMKEDHISVEGKIDELKGELFSLTGDINFTKAPNMGAVLQAALDFVRRNYKTENPFMR